MDLIKKYKAIFIIVVPIVILVLIRATGTNHFRTDARKLADASFSRSNIIGPEGLNQLKGEKLLINLGKDVIKHNFESVPLKTIPPDSILCKSNISILRNHQGPILLYSSETAISVRIWMLLSQMGFRNLFIISDDPDPEVLKYEFRPDTMVRPEL
jgi:hypothetical protein